MLSFWLLALLLIGISLALLLPAFWGRYQRNSSDLEVQNIQVARERLSELKMQLDNKQISDEQYQQQQQELESSLAIDLEKSSEIQQTLLGDKKILHVLAIVFFIPVVSFALYFVLGSPETLFKNQVVHTNSAPANASQPPHSIEDMLATLEQKLVDNPDNLKGWTMLGRSYMSMDRFADAANVFAKITTRFGEQASILLAEADALAMMQSGSMMGKPAQLVKKALKIEPNNITGLWLAGLASQEGGDDKQAIAYWQQAKNSQQLDVSSKQKLQQLITSAENRLGIQPEKNISAAPGINVSVDIDAALKQKTKPTDTVFIFARATQGPRMPLAIVKKQVADLPVEVLLSDEQAMMPNMAISKFDEVLVSARVSFSGQAISQPGDFSAKGKIVKARDESKIKIVIDQIAE